MLISRLVSLLVIFSLACASSAYAQTSATTKPVAENENLDAREELEKNAFDLLEQALAETASLKLPENRALVYTIAGDTLWTKDEKRARILFRNAAGEIMQAANAKVEKSFSQILREADSGNTEIFNLRQTVLRTIAERDAELALEILQATRPPDVAAEMQSYLIATAAAATVTTIPNSKPQPPETIQNVPRNAKVEREIRLEQNLLAKAAEQNPQKAAERIRQLLEKGFFNEIISALQRIYKKDSELANKLFDEMVQKLLAADFSKNTSNLVFAINLTRTFAFPPKENPNVKAEPRLSMSDKALRDVANKIADMLMKTPANNSIDFFDLAFPLLQKVVPERILQLKQKQASLKKPSPTTRRSTGVYQMPASFNDPNATPEKLIADASKDQSRFRGSLYSQAANRAMATGKAEQILGLLQNQPESKERDDAIAQLVSFLAAKQIQAGKMDEARRIIDQMPNGAAKAERIVQMATVSFSLNTKESKENASALMNEALQMVKQFPEDKDEMDGVLKVIQGFAVIEPERAFVMLAPVIEKADEIINAQALLAKYNKQTQIFRENEMMMIYNTNAFASSVSRYVRELKLLAQADFARTRGLIDQFRRDDVRIFAKLLVAQSILKSGRR